MEPAGSASEETPSEAGSGTTGPNGSGGQGNGDPEDAGALDPSSPSGQAGDGQAPTDPPATDPDASVLGPVLVSTTPADGAKDVEADVVVEVEFDRPVHAGSGQIALVDTVTGQAVETIAIDETKVVFAGETLSIDWSTTLAHSASYAVTIESGAVLDEANNPFLGFVEAGAYTFTTNAADELELVETSPASDAKDVALDANVTLTFSENVLPGPVGNVTLMDADSASTVESVALSDTTHVTFDGSSIVVEWSTELAYEHRYYLVLDAGAVLSMAGAAFAGFDDETVLAFTTVGAPALTLVGSSPAAGDLAVDPAASLVLTFNQDVYAASGNIELFTSNDVLVESVAIEDALVTVDSVTIDWETDLESATDYYVRVDAGVVVSPLGAEYAGIDDETTLTFTTLDAPPPPFVLVSTSPADDATDVLVDTNLRLTFDANVVFGNGTVSIVDTSSDQVFETLSASDARVSISGKVVTINPTGTFKGNTNYHVLITAGSFESDLGASFEGLQAPSAWNFSTENSFGLVSVTPENGATDVDPAATLTLTFTDPVEAGDGNIEVWSSSDKLIETIATDDARVEIDGETVSVDLDCILGPSATYYVTVDPGALREASTDTEFPGLGEDDWGFETKAVTRPGSVNSGLVLWLDANYGASLKTATGVRYWADRSGLHNDARQNSGGAQPTLTTDGLNSRDVVHFDGEDDLMLTAGPFLLSAFEGFVVWKSSIAPSTTAQRVILLNGSSFELDHGHHAGASSSLVSCTGDTCSDLASWFTVKFLPTPVADKAYIWDFGFDNLTTSLFTRSQGGSAVYQPGPTEAPSASDQPFALGGNDAYCNGTDGCHFLGDIAEILLYSRPLLQAERLAINTYLQDKWGVAEPTCASDETLAPNGSCYFVSQNSTNWDGARSTCQGRGAGWDLVAVRTQEDDEFIQSLITQEVWIGAKDNGSDAWQWVTDTATFWNGASSGTVANGAYVNWSASEPTDGPNEDCARYKFTTNRAWGDVGCGDQYRFLCEGPSK